MLDKCPVSTYKDIAQVIQEDLGKSPEELFASIEEVPIASASLAQVTFPQKFHLLLHYVYAVWAAVVKAYMLGTWVRLRSDHVGMLRVGCFAAIGLTQHAYNSPVKRIYSRPTAAHLS